MCESLLAVDPDQVRQRFTAWWNRRRPQRPAVYGTGSDFAMLCAAVPEFAAAVAIRVDDSGAAGTITPAELVATDADVVVVCTLAHQESMRRRLRQAGYSGEILLLYANDPELGALLLLQHKPKQDWPLPIPIPTPLSLPAPVPTPLRRLLLVQPPFCTANQRHKKTMPLGLLHLAAAIRRAFPALELELIDAHIERLSWEQMQRRLNNAAFDLLLVSYWSSQANNAYLISQHVRRSRPEVPIIHGGVHATLCPQQALQYADIIVPYEGEQAVVRLLQHLQGGQQAAAPAWWTAAEAAVLPPLQPLFLDNLDDLPLPAWELLADVTRYDHPMHVVGGRRFPIMGSRGCPFSCTFCSSPLFWKGRVRWRTPANVIAEMDEVSRRYQVDKFHFWDDNMLLNREWIQDLGEQLQQRSYQWCGLSRASDLVRQADLLPLLKQAGCVGIEIGVESFADQVSAAVAKGESVEMMRRAVQCLKQAGIAPLYTHMLFTPGENINAYHAKEEFLRSVDYGIGAAMRSDSSLGQLTTPHVATGFAAEAPQLGQVLWRNPGDSQHHRVNFLPHSLLDDVPQRRQPQMPDPLPYLAVIAQAVHDWTTADMRRFVRVAPRLWAALDGRRTVRELAATLIDAETDSEQALVVACLLVVFWARHGLIDSAGAAS